MRIEFKEIFKNILIALAVSFVALSLGAAFGILSGRSNGALMGMLSAGIIAIITSIFGGTRVQCSGPTGPMTAAIAPIIQAAGVGIITAWGYESVNIINPDHFVNIVIIISSVLIIICGLLRLGSLIHYIPKQVISGFMNGIAIIILLSQLKELTDYFHEPGYFSQGVTSNFIALLTLLVIFSSPIIFNLLSKNLKSFFPPTLVAILLISLVSNIFSLEVSNISIPYNLIAVDSIKEIILNQTPTIWSTEIILLALPFSLQITMLCYLDTLLTSLIIDRMTNEKTKRNKELIAQGIGNGFIGFIGGIPGAQATIRSVLMVKEGATLRFTGILVGVFVILEIILFSKWMSYIPEAVFSGVLIKVAYDIFDWVPVKEWVQKIIKTNIKSAITNTDMFFIIGTTILTVLIDLNVAVISFTILFYIFRKFNLIQISEF